jgi:hypothetical protein
MSRKYALILVGVMFVSLALACDFSEASKAAGLPEEAKQELAIRVDSISENHSYTIISAIKATKLDWLRFPPDEVWCVVISPPAPTTWEQYSRFLVKKTGMEWVSEQLLDDDEVTFIMYGCNNWND